MSQQGEFSHRTRESALRRFESETFDLLIIGGGITGAAVARDAVSRGLSVALVEKGDFASGTSSKSSKLIHGGLRYLENWEFGLVFEALSERAQLLKTAPHMVRPLSFYFPVYKGDQNGMFRVSAGMWLYDLLSFFRTPGWHKRLSKRRLLKEIPFLKSERLSGGFKYFDASMWDDGLVIETLRAAHLGGAAIANYVEAIGPLWKGDYLQGFRVRSRESYSEESTEIGIRARKVISCGGAWTDLIGRRVSTQWKDVLRPSKGIHLVFDRKRIPIPGALVMAHPRDGRISFVIPREDLGAGVVIVGTTDGPSPEDPARAAVEENEVDYLLQLLDQYFPLLKLTREDILSAYVGVRPLYGGEAGDGVASLQKVSREHEIWVGPGGAIFVAGGKYTTHRKMAEEIVDFTLDVWRKEAKTGKTSPLPTHIAESNTLAPVNTRVGAEVVRECRQRVENRGVQVPEALFSQYGADALEVLELDEVAKRSSGAHQIKDANRSQLNDPEGFPFLEAQLRYAIRKGMVLRLEDFVLRRVPLVLTRRDQGRPWIERLVAVWAEERGLSVIERDRELEEINQHLDSLRV